MIAGIVRSAVAHEEAAEIVSGFMGSEVFSRLAEGLERPDAQFRLELAVSQLFGVAMARYILKVEPLVSARTETIVAVMGPRIQRYLTEG